MKVYALKWYTGNSYGTIDSDGYNVTPTQYTFEVFATEKSLKLRIEDLKKAVITLNLAEGSLCHSSEVLEVG